MEATRAAVMLALSLALGGCSTEPKLSYAHPCVRVGELRISGPAKDRVFKGRDAEAADWYPLRALQLGKGGTVLLRCDVTRNEVKTCEVVNEDPAGFKFADTALALAKKLGTFGDYGGNTKVFYRWAPIGGRCINIRYEDYFVVTTKPEAGGEKSP